MKTELSLPVFAISTLASKHKPHSTTVKDLVPASVVAALSASLGRNTRRSHA